ncbi:hypothetical protein M9H77_03359 [Catharanthus roseus]|uniref:Uncharacterized protein n=1 Tax=Catharanthus roseus TaxID=4058 RepID=A0ACC0CB17_CATRO|nr:hypothetical protein M9H77_03359 [Catharanthus roseus]
MKNTYTESYPKEIKQASTLESNPHKKSKHERKVFPIGYPFLSRSGKLFQIRGNSRVCRVGCGIINPSMFGSIYSYGKDGGGFLEAMKKETTNKVQKHITNPTQHKDEGIGYKENLNTTSFSQPLRATSLSPYQSKPLKYTKTSVIRLKENPHPPLYRESQNLQEKEVQEKEKLPRSSPDLLTSMVIYPSSSHLEMKSALSHVTNEGLQQSNIVKANSVVGNGKKWQKNQNSVPYRLLVIWPTR